MRIAFFLALLAAGAARADGGFPRPDVKTWQLENGLQIIYLGAHRAPVVSVQMWYHVGSKDEPKNLRGSAHMFEHIMFKGSSKVPPDRHAQMIESIGGTTNAFTSEDTTFYVDNVPKQYLDFTVQLEAERMRGLVFLRKTIDGERDVMKEERRQRVDGSPLLKAMEKLRAAAFSRHPYAWHPLGFVDDFDKVTIEDLRRFYDAYYQPNNAALVVVGDVGEDEVRTAAKQWLGAIPRGKEPPRPAAALAEARQEKARRETGDPGQIGLLFAGFHAPATRSDDIPALRVAEAILGAGDASRLYVRTVRKDQVAVAAGAQLLAFEDPGLFLVFGAFGAPDQAAKLESAIVDEVGRLAREPVGDAELARAKNQILAGLVFRLEGVDGLAAELGRSLMLRGNPTAWLDDYDKIVRVTAADVQRVAAATFAPENMTLLTVPPATGGEK
ncbi:MAG TPA: pitrilysin family protein [Haliangiales bacterium]|nr:pitrilysin family protein [Haliangiales bacterium]